VTFQSLSRLPLHLSTLTSLWIASVQDEHELRRKICHDAPYIMAKACELFIQEVTLRACAHADENKRRTLQKHDILSAVTQTDVFDFLIDIVPRGDASRGMLPGMGAAAHHHPANSAAEGLMALNDQQTRMIQEHFMSAGGAALQQGVSAAEMTDSMRLQGMMMQQHMAMQLSDPQAAAHLQAAWQHLAAGHSHAQRPESESTPPS
jgi:hypothetical protein